VLRQVDYLARHHDLTVVGWGPLPAPRTGVRFIEVTPSYDAAERAAALAALLAGRAFPSAYRAWFAARSHFRDALRHAVAASPDAILANDWNTLPIAAIAAERTGCRVVFDAHEFGPLEWEGDRAWMLLYAPLARWVLRRYAPAADAAMTVSEPIAARYRREYGFAPEVVMNAPPPKPLPPGREVRPGGRVRLIHHGAAIPHRRLEGMIDAVALAGPRFTLDLMLIGDAAYVDLLRRRAAAGAADRIRVVPPVSPREIHARVADYDMGLFVLDDHIFNHAAALPNKLFDYVCAGVPLCIGPSPAMRDLGRRYGFTWIAEDFTPEAVAAALQALTAHDLDRLTSAARRAAGVLNADVEMAKVVDLFANLLPSGGARG
jgi:hypothetical protein